MGKARVEREDAKVSFVFLLRMPEQSNPGHLAIPWVSREGFGGLLADSNLFKEF